MKLINGLLESLVHMSVVTNKCAASSNFEITMFVFTLLIEAADIQQSIFPTRKFISQNKLCYYCSKQTSLAIKYATALVNSNASGELELYFLKISTISIIVNCFGVLAFVTFFFVPLFHP